MRAVTATLCEVLPVPTYVTADLNTTRERHEIFRSMSVSEAFLMALCLMKNYPGVFDEVSEQLPLTSVYIAAPAGNEPTAATPQTTKDAA